MSELEAALGPEARVTLSEVKLKLTGNLRFISVSTKPCEHLSGARTFEVAVQLPFY